VPLYEYTCLGCEREFELLILGTSQVPACPACASTSVAFAYNNRLNAKQEPDKARIQIDHPHQH
jgi:putative FmdB family regulatory protein